MADQALAMDSDADKPVRKCAWCGAVFSHGNAARTLCSSRCKKASYNHRNRERINASQRDRNRTVAAREARAKYEARLREERKARRELQRKARQDAIMKASAIAKIRACPTCGCVFSALTRPVRYCSSKCAVRSPSRYENRARLERSERYKGKKRARDKVLFTAEPERFRARKRQSERRRAAERALALLLMPVHQTPEAK